MASTTSPGLELQFAVEQLYTRSAKYLDDGPIEQWAELFTNECAYQIISRPNFESDLPLAIMRCDSKGMLKDRIVAVESTMMYEPRYLRHHITNVMVSEMKDGSCVACANFSVIETLPDELPRILITGHYQDRIVSRDAGLLFAEKYCIYDSDLIPNTIVFPV